MNPLKWNKEQWKEAGISAAFTLVLFAMFYYIFH